MAKRVRAAPKEDNAIPPPAELARQLAEMSEEERRPLVDGLERVLLASLASEDSPDGFAAFYRLVHGNDLPGHARKWIEHIYGAHDEGIGALLFAWRGSWKSTTISVTFLAFRIGKEPAKTSLVISANDDSADKLTAAIAAMIEHNDAWKLVYPHIMPDKERGWGAEGYWVKDARVSPEAWAKETSSRIDPSLLGAGVSSSRIIGKHPSGVLLLDDIHDEKNSASSRERASVSKIVSDTILPTAIKSSDGKKILTWEIAIGTPWADDDAYHYLKGTGLMAFLSMPVAVKAEEGDTGAVWIEGRNRDGLVFTDLTGWWILTDPKRWGPEAITAARALGLRSFARMYLLDLKASKVTGLRYYLYPHQEIDAAQWSTGGGCDFATVIRKGMVDDPGRDYFSHSYGAKTPLNKLVVFDGVIEQCTQAQAEDHLEKPQTVFPRWTRTVIEGDGAGEQFYISLLRRKPGLRVTMMKTGGRAKRDRQEREMGPWLELGTVMISDADTPYLNALRKALDEFPDGNNDIRDGLYWLCKAFPEVLMIPKQSEELARPEAKAHRANPFNSLARA